MNDLGQPGAAAGGRKTDDSRKLRKQIYQNFGRRLWSCVRNLERCEESLQAVENRDDAVQASVAARQYGRASDKLDEAIALVLATCASKLEATAWFPGCGRAENLGSKVRTEWDRRRYSGGLKNSCGYLITMLANALSSELRKHLGEIARTEKRQRPRQKVGPSAVLADDSQAKNATAGITVRPRPGIDGDDWKDENTDVEETVLDEVERDQQLRKIEQALDRLHSRLRERHKKDKDLDIKRQVLERFVFWEASYECIHAEMSREKVKDKLPTNPDDLGQWVKRYRSYLSKLLDDQVERAQMCPEEIAVASYLVGMDTSARGVAPAEGPEESAVEGES